MSDKRNEDLKQFIIPENFMGESRLFQGQLKTRNVVEGGLISGVLAIFFWNVISVPRQRSITAAERLGKRACKRMKERRSQRWSD